MLKEWYEWAQPQIDRLWDVMFSEVNQHNWKMKTASVKGTAGTKRASRA